MTFAYSESIIRGMKTRKRMGRPPKAANEKFSEQVNVKMTSAELSMLKAEAKRRGVSLSALMMGPWRESEKKGG